MSVGVIIVAAGRGARTGASQPKQFADLGGRTMVSRAVAAFDRHPRVSDLVVVLPREFVAEGARLIGATTRPCAFVAGGDRRQDSVRHGMNALPAGASVVLVHDAARPFVDAALIDRVIDGVLETGAVIPAVQARETVKRVDRGAGVVKETIDRNEIWLAQTPQGFRRQLLIDLMAASGGDSVATDEAMLAESSGHKVRVVPGDERNVKITTMDDLTTARARFEALPRAGTGYDLHRLVDGRQIILAGVVLPGGRGPEAHSDGDVVCHALVDAILGAAGAGDIGRHFPNDDPRWKDAAGLDLLARAVAIAAAKGWLVGNVDVTVILERPKLAPHVDAIRAYLAGALGVGIDSVSVKAKTNEGVDAVGRGEAIAAHAVAVLTR